MTDAIDLKTKLASFKDTWHPRVIGEANGQLLKLAHCEGTLEWHMDGEVLKQLSDVVELGPCHLALGLMTEKDIGHRSLANQVRARFQEV